MGSHAGEDAENSERGGRIRHTNDAPVRPPPRKRESEREEKKSLKSKILQSTAVFCLAGFIIGAVVRSVSNALKDSANGVDSGLQALDKKKIADILPSLLGAIVS